MFEHISAWGSRTQKRWFGWQGLQLASQRHGHPVRCEKGHELTAFTAYPCNCGARLHYVGPARPPAAEPRGAPLESTTYDEQPRDWVKRRFLRPIA